MKCLHCGREGEGLLCPECRTEDILERVFYDILYYKPDVCENPYIVAYASSMPEKYAERDCIPQILALFPSEITDYYFCVYYRAVRDPQFEEKALGYLARHDLWERNTQRILYGLLDFYLRNDFIKPRKWCDLIREKENVGAELITIAIQNYSMTGEYDLADQMIEKALHACAQGKVQFLYGGYDPERMDRHKGKLERLKTDNERYKTKKPYWPTTEERRRAVALLYDEKGIAYPRIESRPQKVSESNFKALAECAGPCPDTYCAFWCATGFSLVAAKSIYQIAAVKVENGKVVDRFQSYIRPWDSIAARQAAAKAAGIAVEVLEGAEDVDLVMKRFFDFVGDCVLVSTDALGEQAKLLSRAARYTGMNAIPNQLLDLLDLAEDTLPDYDPTENAREYLLRDFQITEGEDAQGRAIANHELYQKLKAMGG